MEYSFTAPLFEWRGPAPFYFIGVPKDLSDEIKIVAKELSYGWGVITCSAAIGETEWRTSLMPKDGRYLVPIKNVIRHKFDLDVDDEVTLIVKLSQ